MGISVNSKGILVGKFVYIPLTVMNVIVAKQVCYSSYNERGKLWENHQISLHNQVNEPSGGNSII